MNGHKNALFVAVLLGSFAVCPQVWASGFEALPAHQTLGRFFGFGSSAGYHSYPCGIAAQIQYHRSAQIPRPVVGTYPWLMQSQMGNVPTDSSQCINCNGSVAGHSSANNSPMPIIEYTDSLGDEPTSSRLFGTPPDGSDSADDDFVAPRENRGEAEVPDPIRDDYQNDHANGSSTEPRREPSSKRETEPQNGEDTKGYEGFKTYQPNRDFGTPPPELKFERVPTPKAAGTTGTPKTTNGPTSMEKMSVEDVLDQEAKEMRGPASSEGLPANPTDAPEELNEASLRKPAVIYGAQTEDTNATGGDDFITREWKNLREASDRNDSTPRRLPPVDASSQTPGSQVWW